MNDLDRFRQQATRCRARASTLTAPEAAEQWLKLAAEYDRLANTLQAETVRPLELTRIKSAAGSLTASVER